MNLIKNYKKFTNFRFKNPFLRVQVFINASLVTSAAL